ncbi:AMP-binding protein [Nocardia sp. NPDC048505]|uniref:AMP-binding protein n=1 Tax=Nocardia sp. NPDC048505 TaxID=3155756 RepID=UPI0033C62319
MAGVLAALSNRPDEVVIRWQEGALGRRELFSAIVSSASVLRGQGIGPGHTVAILAESNSPMMLFVRYAANLLGATVVYLRSTNAASSVESLPDDQQLAILHETAASLLAVDPAHVERGRRLCAALDRPIDIATYASGYDMIDLSAGASDVPPDLPIAADARAVITYTTGTTGRPKGICRSFRAWNYAVATMLDAEQTVMLVTTPLSHTVGPIADAILTSGGTLQVLAGFEPGIVLDSIAAHRITRVFWATPQIYQLLDHPRLATTDLSSLKTLMYGGIPAAPARLQQAAETLGPVLVQSYGTTECWEIASLGHGDHSDEQRLASVGRPSGQADIVVRDPDTGAEVPAGDIGEICVSSPGLLTEYFRDPARTAHSLRGKWFHTGDLGYLDRDGYLYLVDRLQHRIKFDGVNVYPAEVEKTLLTHPAIAQAAVFGVLDADRIERVHAAIVLKPAMAVTTESLRDYVRERMTPRHAPDVLHRYDDLPVIGSGKIDKQRLHREVTSISGSAG